MSLPPRSSATDQVVRLSLAWIILGLAAVVLLGLAGGLVADQLFRPALTPLTPEGNNLRTTVQEVTISPNTAAADVITQANRSVLLLGRGNSDEARPERSGFVLTNDGVVVTSAELAGNQPVAFDHEGRLLPLTVIGRDEVFGLTFFRINDNVVVPLDLRQDDSPVGHELLLVSRSPQTFQPVSHEYRLAEYQLPTETDAAGVQRVMVSARSFAEITTGSPLLDEEGRVAAILTRTSGTALPVSLVRASLQRLTNNQREIDPFAQLGLTVHYAFERPAPTDPVQFVATVQSISPGTSASVSDLRVGDQLTHIQATALSWQQSVAAQLAATLPLTVGIRRESETQEVTLPLIPTASVRP